MCFRWRCGRSCKRCFRSFYLVWAFPSPARLQRAGEGRASSVLSLREPVWHNARQKDAFIVPDRRLHSIQAPHYVRANATPLQAPFCIVKSRRTFKNQSGAKTSDIFIPLPIAGAARRISAQHTSRGRHPVKRQRKNFSSLTQIPCRSLQKSHQSSRSRRCPSPNPLVCNTTDMARSGICTC